MTYKFKSNINCIACVQVVSPYLEDEKAINYWHVDTDDPEKTLMVETNSLSPEELIAIVRKAGYTAELQSEEFRT